MLAEFLGIRPKPAYVNATLENPRYSLDSPELYALLTGGRTAASGVVVSEATGLSLAPVWQAVSIISGDVAAMPCYVYRRSDDDRSIDAEHPANYAISEVANRETAAFFFWRQFVVHLALWNNAYAWIGRANNGQIELYNLLPDRTAPQRLRNGRLAYVTEVDGAEEVLRFEDVLHVRGLSYDGSPGCNFVQAARDSWGLALANIGFASKFFKNGARIGGVLELPAAMTKTSKDTVEEGFRKTYEGGDNPFKTVILRDNAKFHAAQVTPQEAQMVEGRDADAREIARWFNLPPSKLGIKDSMSYNSQEQDNLNYLTGCLRHVLRSIKSECQLKLLTEAERRERTHFIEHNTSTFIEIDSKSQNEVLEIQRRNEIINPNEWRRKLNLAPRTDPGGEEYRNPNNPPPTEPGAEEPAESDPPAQNVLAELLSDTLRRFENRMAENARKAAKDSGRYLSFLEAEQGRVTATCDGIRPVARVLAATLGLNEAEVMGACEGRSRSTLNLLASVTDPPYKAADLERNVQQILEQATNSLAPFVANILERP